MTGNRVNGGLQTLPPGVTTGCHGMPVCMHTPVHSKAQIVHTLPPSLPGHPGDRPRPTRRGYIKNTRYSEPQSTEIDPPYAQIEP